ncbi:IclR family transcriptional regulator [Gordonia jinhuaensis]|uniref:Glycerol operon regulatory protein n=1 Tax=Gordonia jinhuaensis TaxID=1517702 RepID=A0A916T113_9ACTN|nr:IclR family transcriptional regulator [Gordonia jinhuaensis]GGB27301.1 IclR family transcriptional regulator [Gordonia jinhuaensis]
MPGSIQSIERAAALLDLLSASSRPLLLREIVDELELPKSTVHGLLRTLVELEYVEQADGSGAYSVGEHRGIRAGATLDGNVLRSVSMGWCDTLASITGRAVILAVLDDQVATVVHHVFRPDDTPQQLRVGENLPLHATASGKVLLANLPSRSRLLRNLVLERYTPATIVSRRDLTAEIDSVRHSGIGVCNTEYEPDSASIAAPVRGPSFGSVGAVAVTGAPAVMLGISGEPRPELVDELRKTATAISQAMEPRR